jgi:PhnB protein
MTIKPIPDGYHSLTPYLGIKDTAEAIEFYKRAFSATELFRLVAPSGEIGHAEIKIGNSAIMLADPCETGPVPQSAVTGRFVDWPSRIRRGCGCSVCPGRPCARSILR